MLKNFSKKNYFPIFLLFLFIIILFFKIIFLKLTFFGGDTTLQVFPIRVYIADMLKNRIFPLWTPDIFCGYPLFAGGETGVFFPFNLLFSIFPSIFTYNLFLIVLPFFLSCIFTYYFCRLLLFDRFSSFISSVSYFFSGFFMFFLCNPLAFCIFCFLPLKLIFLELYIRKNKISYLIFIIFILSIQFLGGNPQIVFISFLGVFLYFLFTLYCKRIIFIKFIFITFFLGGGSLLLSSVQILPSFELYRFARGDILPSFEFMTDLSLSPRLLLASFFHFGYPEEYGQSIQELGYMDILPFILVLFSLFFYKDKLSKFFFISLFVCLVLSSGKYNPLFKVFIHIPLINQMRYPILFLFVGFFFLSLLAGLSMNNILRLEDEKKRQIFRASFVIVGAVYILFISFLVFNYKQENYFFSLSDFLAYFLKETKIFIILTTVIFTLLVLYFAGKISSGYFKKLIVIYIFCTLFLTPPYLLPHLSDANYVELLRDKDIDKNIYIVPSTIYPKSPEYVEFLKENKELYRVYNDYKTTPLQRSLGLLYKIPCVFGYLPLHFARFERYLSLFYEDIYVQGLNLMNVKYILDKKMEEVPVGVENEIEKLVYNQEISIIENKKCLPRAFVVYKSLVIEDEGKILEKLNDKNFSPLEYVILEDGFEKEKTVQQSPVNIVSILKYLSQEVIIKANLVEDGFLVLSDTYYPGWKVYVNGKEDKIYRANYLFRAIYLKKGEHKIKFIYEPLSFKIGLIISVFTLFILVIILIYAKIKRI